MSTRLTTFATFALVAHSLCSILASGERLTLDLSSAVDTSKIVKSGYQSGGVSHFTYTPNIDIAVVKVRDASTTIWSAKLGERCSYFSIFRRCGTVFRAHEPRAIVYLRVRKGKKFANRYYQLVNGRWRSIPYAHYLELFGKVLPERQFDLSVPVDGDIFMTTEQDVFGTPITIYTPFSVFKITSLIDGEATLWRAKGNETCTFVVVHGKHSGDAKLVHIFVQNGMDYNVMYFVRMEETWALVTKDAFFKRLDE